MTRTDKVLCSVYGLIAFAALLATWSHNIAFVLETSNPSVLSFFRALYVNPAAASVANDILFYALAGSIFMVVEGRRLQMRHVWVYILLSLFLAISVMFPIFLIARQFKIAEQRA